MIIMELCRFSVSDALRMDVRRVVMNRVGRHVLDDRAHEYTPMPPEELLTKRIHHIFAQHSELPADEQRPFIERNIAKWGASQYYNSVWGKVQQKHSLDESFFPTFTSSKLSA